MDSGRIYLFLIGAIFALSLILGAQVYSLYENLQEKDRIIRRIGGQIRQNAATLPSQAEKLDGKNERVFSLRLRLRAKEQEGKRLREAAERSAGEVASLREQLTSRTDEIREMKQRLERRDQELPALRQEISRLESEVMSLRPLQAQIVAKEKQAADLRERNAELVSDIEELKREIEILLNEQELERGRRRR